MEVDEQCTRQSAVVFPGSAICELDFKQRKVLAGMVHIDRGRIQVPGMASLLIPWRYLAAEGQVFGVRMRVSLRIENRKRKSHACQGLFGLAGKGQFELRNRLATGMVVAKIESIQADRAFRWQSYRLRHCARGQYTKQDSYYWQG